MAIVPAALLAALAVAQTSWGQPQAAGGSRDATFNLHNHTYCSDGSDSPEMVVERAKKAGVRTLSITDHDSVSCLPRALEAAGKAGLRLINGIEISAEDDSMHILALNVDAKHPELGRLLERNRQARLERSREIVGKLSALGLRITLKEVLLDKLNDRRKADGEPPLAEERARAITEDELLADLDAPLTRPDIAKTLVRLGHVPNVRSAFDRYLGDQGQAASDMQGPAFREALRAVHAAGGIAALAHPHTIYKFKPKPWTYSGKLYGDFAALLEDMLAAGLDGIEQYKNRYGPEGWIVDIVARYSRRSGRGVLFTPGSDYHGSSGAGEPELAAISIPASTAKALDAAFGGRGGAAPAAPAGRAFSETAAGRVERAIRAESDRFQPAP